MNTAIEVICYKSKTLSNGESPLMLRITQQGKRIYKSLGISVNPNYWDFTKNKPKRNCPNKDLIENLISEKKKLYSQTALEYKSRNKDYTAKTLIDQVDKPSTPQTVGNVILAQIKRLQESKRNGYAIFYKQTYNTLLKFNKHLDIYFSEIDITWLKNYEAWLRKEGNSDNTIGIKFRTLRAIYNVAITEKIVKPEYYPFDVYKVSKLHEETAKRALTKKDTLRVIQHRSNDSDIILAIDIFAFSYFMGGINFVDIALLTLDNIIDNRLIYKRKKTGKLIKLPINQNAKEIINKYQRVGEMYLFPILSSYHQTEQQKANRVHKVISRVNKNLREVGKELKLPITLTTYVARHSFATVLKRSGVATSIISESLGHSSEKVTQIYLDNFENEQIDDAMKSLI